MPPKLDPTAIHTVILRVTGGEGAATAALAPKIGPLGLAPKKISEDIAKNTTEWKGLRITVKLTVQNRQAKIEVLPSASSLVIRALREPPRDKKKVKNIKHEGSITFDEVIAIARQMRPRSMANHLKGTVKEILGTAQSVGCKVDGLNPHDIIVKVDSGEYSVPEK
jgi:large subunit ribosomal protein L12e